MNNWEIIRADGKYIGRSSAVDPAVAFCQCMMTYGMIFRENDVAIQWLQDNSYGLTCRGEVYQLRPSPVTMDDAIRNAVAASWR